MTPREQVDEAAAEQAYWDFDARRKGYSVWKGQPQTERDAFKAELRITLADARRAGLEEAKYSARIEAFDEVKAMIACHHAPSHWYFKWLIKKMNERIIDCAQAAQEEAHDVP